MKNIFFAILTMGVFIAGCSKSDDKCNYLDSTLIAPSTETTAVQTYLTDNGITASQLPSGLFYSVTTQGTGQGIVNLCSKITVNYKGRLTNGTTFDSTASGTPATFQLGMVITGWQKGVPLISKGGKITLYIPPTLGYGATDVKNNAGVIVVPKNSILIFEIELLDIT